MIGTVLLYVTLGALLGLGVRKAAGIATERLRRQAETQLGHGIELQATQRKLNALAERYRELETLLGSMQQLVKASAPAALVDLGERLAKIEARDATIHLQVMDAAEKVARRLGDRERKRDQKPPSHGEFDEIELMGDRDLMLAEAKRQFPLFPGDAAPERELLERES